MFCEMCCIEVRTMVVECTVVEENYVVYVSEVNAHKIIILNGTYVNETNVHKIIILDKEVVVLNQLISQMENTKLMQLHMSYATEKVIAYDMCSYIKQVVKDNFLISDLLVLCWKS